MSVTEDNEESEIKNNLTGSEYPKFSIFLKTIYSLSARSLQTMCLFLLSSNNATANHLLLNFNSSSKICKHYPMNAHTQVRLGPAFKHHNI